MLSWSQCKTYHLIPQSKCLISAGLGSKLSQVLLGNICYEYVLLLFITIIIIGCNVRKLWKCYGFGKFFIPSLICFNSLTRPSFKSFYMSVTSLKSFESSYCVIKSPTRSDRMFCWMFCLVLRNSLTIKSLFLGSVIFRNYMFILAIFLFF